MPKPLVIQTEHLDPVAAAWLSERCELIRCSSDDASFPALLARTEGLVIRTYTQITPAFLAGAPKLRVIGRAGVGLDNVDLPACASRGITVCNTPDANTRAVVEYVLALMLDATRPRAPLATHLSTPDWNNRREELKATKQLCELTLGIWGLGKIGRQVARAAAALNMRVIYHDLLDIAPEHRSGASPVSRDELCSQADIITIHVDGRRSNRGIVGTAAFSRMKPGVLLINSSRGFVVDNPSLATFLRQHHAAAAMLDVHEPEPFGPEYPLLGLPNAHLYPHIASSTVLANANMSWVVRDVWRVLSGEKPEFPGMPDPD